MHEIAVDGIEILAILPQIEQIRPHVDEFAGCAGRAVETAKQFLPQRLGREMKIATGAADTVAPRLDRLIDLAPVGPELAGQGFKKYRAFERVEATIGIEDLAGIGGAGGFAPSGQQFFAELDRAGGVALFLGRP